MSSWLVPIHCRCSWLTTAWQRSTVTTARGNTYRTVKTRTWQAQLDMQVWMLTLVLSRVDVMTWSHLAMYWCTSTVARCRGKDLRWQQCLFFVMLWCCASYSHHCTLIILAVCNGLWIKHASCRGFCCAKWNADAVWQWEFYLSVCLSNAWFVTKRKKVVPAFSYHTKDHLP